MPLPLAYTSSSFTESSSCCLQMEREPGRLTPSSGLWREGQGGRKDESDGTHPDFSSFSQSHRRQHNKDKPFKCHNCHRAYTDAASLEVHLSTHTVKHAKVYTCTICSRAYTSVSAQCFPFTSPQACRTAVHFTSSSRREPLP